MIESDILITATSTLEYLLEEEELSTVQYLSLVVDKMEDIISLELQDDLLACVKKISNSAVKTKPSSEEADYSDDDALFYSRVITTNEKSDLDPVFKSVMDDKKSVIIRLNEEQRETSKFERMGHLLVDCKSECEKYLILYSFLKLNILNGKTIVLAKDLEEAYKVKVFLNKFQIKTFVINPEGTKNNRKTVVHFFNIG